MRAEVEVKVRLPTGVVQTALVPRRSLLRNFMGVKRLNLGKVKATDVGDEILLRQGLLLAELSGINYI